MDYDKKYLKYKEKYIALKELYMKGGNDENPKLIAFTAKWCGHCTNFMPLYNKMKKYHSKKIDFINYDSEDKDKMKKYNITGYPTLYLEHKNKLVEYSGNRSEKDILDFVNKYSKKN